MYVFLNESLYVMCVERLPRVRVYCIYIYICFFFSFKKKSVVVTLSPQVVTHVGHSLRVRTLLCPGAAVYVHTGVIDITRVF